MLPLHQSLALYVYQAGERIGTSRLMRVSGLGAESIVMWPPKRASRSRTSVSPFGVLAGDGVRYEVDHGLNVGRVDGGGGEVVYPITTRLWVA
jgi:hypothetical protein